MNTAIAITVAAALVFGVTWWILKEGE